MRVNSSILALIPQLLQPDRIFQPTTYSFPYGQADSMPARIDTFHEGETAVRTLLKVPPGRNPTAAGLPASYAARVAASPLLAVGTLDAEGRPWTTLWGGAPGAAEPVAPDVLGVSTGVDTAHDPVYGALWGDARGAGGVVQPAKMAAALAIDLETRDRVKLMGAVVAGSADTTAGTLQMALLVQGSLGNCPKYLNRKRVAPRAYGPDTALLVAEDGRVLPTEATRLLDRADLFFLSSTDGETMDTNHRGGPPGFVRVLRNEADEAVIVYPEYSGNRLYQTLGNLHVNPLVGLVVPDFATADVLYLTGRASLLVGAAAAAIMPRTTLAVQVTIRAARFVRAGLPLRGVASLEPSPYNPPVRPLLAERAAAAAAAAVTATLVDRQVLTPTVARFTFALAAGSIRWRAGQHVTLDFSAELDHGYAHMRDEDPQSLNDDFVRTFTVSNTPPPPPDSGTVEMQITARRHGPATNLLWRHNLRAELAVPVLGFGGAESFHLPAADAAGGAAARRRRPVFVAGGVGITPLLAQARGVLDAGVGLRLLWSVSARDVALVTDTFARIEGLAGVTTLFVSGAEEDTVGTLREQGVEGVHRRRIGAGDVKTMGGPGTRFYLCTGPALLRSLQDWLDGEDVVWEDFGY
ncbi:oxidoreductase FAD-binding domain-containing [Cordyceps militaris]|uniref:Oxidoreductase FAD-binding domain-containing n=1 Tax=Cordyceps militaris TaxID=73501 RepID=A0A2H4S737_CORMI|nr:oxidoreductase FAD-binding domain-containing [Cordyceps militaris]